MYWKKETRLSSRNQWLERKKKVNKNEGALSGSKNNVREIREATNLVTGSSSSHGMADEDAEQEIRSALNDVYVVQSMIDISAERLEGLRTQCSTSAELTQQEIRTLEVRSDK